MVTLFLKLLGNRKKPKQGDHYLLQTFTSELNGCAHIVTNVIPVGSWGVFLQVHTNWRESIREHVLFFAFCSSTIGLHQQYFRFALELVASSGDFIWYSCNGFIVLQRHP
jgi:hypothetical protein